MKKIFIIIFIKIIFILSIYSENQDDSNKSRFITYKEISIKIENDKKEIENLTIQIEKYIIKNKNNINSNDLNIYKKTVKIFSILDILNNLINEIELDYKKKHIYDISKIDTFLILFYNFEIYEDFDRCKLYISNLK